MCKILIIILSLCLFFSSSFSNPIHYPAFLINDSLKKEASLVKRYDELTIIIKSPGKAILHRKYAYTILNESADDFATFYDYYTKFRSINSIDGTLYDALGKEIKSVKKKDIADLSGTGESSLITDVRYKQHNFYYTSYPYTVEYEYEDEYDGLLNLPRWVPQANAGVAVEFAKLTVIAPADYKLRYKQFNYPSNPVITNSGDKTTYTWQVKDLYAIKGERWMPEVYEIVPTVMLGLTDFEAEGYKGNMSTWEGYGKFIYDLLKNRDVLPENVKQKVHELTDDLKDDKQKVNVLYDYLQKNTRYISIQLGIGGLQPFDANYVATKKYGDCKALSNYMVALLKEAGLKGNSVVIESGEDAEPMKADFPSDQFDHVIACVPLKKDTVWLECTSQTESPGFMGTFTGGRKAILIDEKGGHVVNTPDYASKDNLQIRKVDAAIDEQGNLKADIHTSFSGERQELTHSLMYGATKEQREKYLNNVINLPTYIVDKNEYKEQKGAIPIVNEYLHIVAQSYASISGKRLFIEPNLFNKSGLKLRTDEERKYDIINKDAYKDVDSIVIAIPEGYTLESLPKDLTINNKFENYNISFKFSDNKITVVRINETNKWRYPKTDYPDLVKYYNDVYKADRSRIVFIKKES